MSRKPPEPDFLTRWSERKRKAADPAPEAEPQPPAPAPEVETEKSEAEILEELGLPDPDTLGPGADFKAFMQKAVPDQIRRRALRRLWGTDPVLANLDQLVDYGEDFTDRATVVANLQSAWVAGRGYAEKVAEKAGAEGSRTPPETAADEPAATAEPDAPKPETARSEASDDGPGEHREDEAETQEAETEEAASEEARLEKAGIGGAGVGAEDRHPHPPRRRMRFAFDD